MFLSEFLQFFSGNSDSIPSVCGPFHVRYTHVEMLFSFQPILIPVKFAELTYL